MYFLFLASRSQNKPYVKNIKQSSLLNDEVTVIFGKEDF